MVPTRARESESLALISNPKAYEVVTKELGNTETPFDLVAGIESRGFIFGTALAHQTHKGLALARKPNKLPLASHREFYGLEYGQDSLEIQKSTLPNHARVLLLDDVLATGGTLIAADKLLRNAGFAVCGAITLLEIGALNGSANLNEHGIPNKSVLIS